MWQETKHGLYRQFNFEDFKQAFAFMVKIADLAEEIQHHPRWENEWNVVQIWLITHEGDQKITDKDWQLARAIDAVFEGKSQDGVTAALEKENQNALHKKIIIYADGGSRGNPGPSASGYVLLDEHNNTLVDKGVYLGITTNNQAEYQALKLALENAQRLQAQDITVYMDSMLVINQMKGIFKVKNRDLWPIHNDIKQLVKAFHRVNFNQVPRELNKQADAAVNRALDEQAREVKTDK